MKLSDRIKKYRQDDNLTQKELASKLFVSRSAVAKWEQGRGFPDKDTLKTLSTLLEVNEDELLSQNELRNITIETAGKINKQKLFNIIGIISLSLLCIVFMSFAIFFIKNKQKEPIIETKSFHSFVDVNEDYYLFYTLSYYDSYKHPVIPFYDAVKLDPTTPCYDRSGKEIELSCIRSGIKVIVTYSETTLYKGKNSNPNTTTEIDKIEIFDDYLEGDYIIKGFF